MRILVVGGAGYIGAHMCKMLAGRGHEVFVLDNLSTGHREAVRWGSLFVGDLGDADVLHQVFAAARPEAVMHFAARSIVPESVAEPAAYFRNNVAATLTLLDFVRRESGCVFIFSSTAAVYGMPQQEKVTESHPCHPINPYGASKLMVERVLADYWAAYRLSSVCFRYFNAAGADPSGEIGEAHHPETHLIPRILESVLGRLDAVRVFGTDYPTRDGTCIRDYVHVNDLCAAHLAGIAHGRSNPGAHVFNLGNGNGFSVREVLRAAEEAIGRPIPHQMGPRRPGDPPVLVADAQRAGSELGWQPQITSLAEIIRSAWRWHASREC